LIPFWHGSLSRAATPGAEVVALQLKGKQAPPHFGIWSAIGMTGTGTWTPPVGKVTWTDRRHRCSVHFFWLYYSSASLQADGVPRRAGLS
jgi:hypothetical protein